PIPFHDLRTSFNSRFGTQIYSIHSRPIYLPCPRLVVLGDFCLYNIMSPF
ncbi:hypothetical protein L9F63_015915, partial [Diploptera punctata]